MPPPTLHAAPTAQPAIPEPSLAEIHDELVDTLQALDTNNPLLATGILLGLIDHLRAALDPDLPTTREEALAEALNTHPSRLTKRPLWL